ncbi:MAG: protein jag [Firmicutes bacterium]|jgi:spoIIIJ-associated protein|nr:protein jag [Bacillota bacterium]
MKTLEITGKTVESAIDAALMQLNTTIDKVDVEILENASKGFLGFGAKEARVKVVLKEDSEDIAREFLMNIFKQMNIEAELTIEVKKEGLFINIVGKHMAILIGKRGQTLDSLQYLVSLVVNKNRDDYLRVVLDTENYRKKREETLIKLANKLAYKVKKYRKSVVLEPMNPYERRIIHSAVQNNEFVNTRSEGEEPYRKVVLYLNK